MPPPPPNNDADDRQEQDPNGRNYEEYEEQEF